MNYYSSYTGNRKKKTVRRVLIVVISIAVIFGATVVLGNYLKKRSENSGTPEYDGIGREDIFAETDSPVIIPPSEDGAGSSESVQGLCVPLGAVDSEEGSFEDRLADASDGYTGVLIPLTGEDGLLLYGSDRAAAASRLPANPSIPDMEALTAAVSAAHAKGLRVTAYIRSGVDIKSDETAYNEAITADSRIAADAAQAGFDEIIIGSLVTSPEDITGDSSHIILKYLNQMTGAAVDTQVGLALPPEIYEVATLSPQIELFVSRSVFLAMELTADSSTVEHLNYICENLAGTMSVYNMRMLFSPKDTEIGDGIEKKLMAVEHNNYMFTSVLEKSEPPEVSDSGKVTEEPVTTE